MSPEDEGGKIGILVNLLFWLFFLAIIAISLLITIKFDSVLLGSTVFFGFALVMGYISLKVKAGRPK